MLANNFIHNCQKCINTCDGKSKNVYLFEKDVDFSEFFENRLVQAFINKGFFAKKTEKDGYPDIEIYDKNNKKLLCYIELKAQRRTFMSVKTCLPEANLSASETMVLNLSDLLRYIEIKKEITSPVFIMWMLEKRPCIVENKIKAYIQDIEKLDKIYQEYGDKRRFRRKSGVGDIVDGQHKGVVVNYHFSLKELEEFNIESFIDKYLTIKN